MSPRKRRFAFALAALAAAAPLAADEEYAAARARLIQEIRADVEWTAGHIGKDRLDERVLKVLGRLPRHEFVRPGDRDVAYANRPLPIGYGQTISQPYIVALMTDLLEIEPGDKLLEVGSGSAYQAAVLAELADEVFTIEIVPQLGRQAAERLERLGYDNATVRIGDGYDGWPEEAPFDGILVAAAASHIPPPLVAQLKPGAHMIIPVGGPFATQHLVLVTKLEDGGVRTRQVLPVRFVPLTRAN